MNARAPWLCALAVAACVRGAGERTEGRTTVSLAAVSVNELRRSNADLRFEGGAIALRFLAPGAFIEGPPEAFGVSRDGRRLRALTAVVESGAAPVDVSVAVVGAPGRLSAARSLGAGHTAVLTLPLAELPLANWEGPAFEVRALRFEAWFPPGPAREVRLRDLSVDVGPAPSASPLVDGFGQRVQATWAGKVVSARDLVTARDAETKALAAVSAPQARDEYGGWRGGDLWQATGFFGVERDGDGRAWLVDPAGHPFFSLGVSDVGPIGGLIAPAGREHLFAAIPARGTLSYREAFAERDGVVGLSFYRWNVSRKYGELSAWRERTLARAERWGLVTLGVAMDGGDPGLWQQRYVPHVRRLSLLEGRFHDNGRFHDADVDRADAPWRARLDARVSSAVAGDRSNPWIVGYLVDAPSWSGPEGRPVLTAAAAESHFRAAAAALAAHAPEHLVIGGRLPAPGSLANEAQIVRAAARHARVLTVAWDEPTFERARLDAWHAAAEGWPVIVDVRGLPVDDARQSASATRAPAAAERGRAFERLVGELAAVPYVVGVHLRHLVDPPRATGATELVGLVDVTDQPHRDLVEAFRRSAASVYARHAASR